MKLLSQRAAARRWKVTVRTLQRLHAKGLPHTRRRGCVFYDAAAGDLWFEAWDVVRGFGLEKLTVTEARRIVQRERAAMAEWEAEKAEREREQAEWARRMGTG